LLGTDVVLAAEPRSPFHPALPELMAELNGAGDFEVVSAWELRTYMADVLLRDTDVMSMRHSLELRVPLIDRRLVEWVWQQPAAFKFDPDQPKGAFSAAVADILPPGLAQRRKHGFSLPFPIWMKRELKPFLDEAFSDASVNRSGLFDQGAVQQLWRGFQTGHDAREWSRVWSLAMLLAFVNRGRPTTAPQPVPTVATVSSATVSGIRTKHRSKPRVLLLAPEIFASEGGIPRILQLYLKSLCEIAEPDGEVRLLALNDLAFKPERVRQYANASLREQAACGRNKLEFIRTALRMSRRSDVIICGHVFLLPVAWLAARLNRRLRYALVAHGIEVWRSFRISERIALRGASRVLCVSDFTRQELLKNCPLPDGRAVVLHNALDPRFTIAAGLPLFQCAPVILVVTRLTWDDRYKGVQHMIEAMPAIRRAIPDAILRVIGRGDDLERLRALARENGMSNAVEFLGYVEDTRLVEELKSCRLFALPSRKEGFGLVFLEAMAHGRPCLGARAGGIPEVISPETGVLADYGDVPGIACAAIAALREPWSEAAILDRARAFAYEPFKDRLNYELNRLS
jgi:glycosyltransferase involved in cell wall biosynthesis